MVEMIEDLLVKERISDEVIDLMLEPYFENCRYLKEAEMKYGDGAAPSATGRFEIPGCCYGYGPGHFNATELIICFNQLAYVLLANGVEKRVLPELNMDNMHDFKAAQMDGAYIGRIKDVVFKKPINPREFNGSLSIAKTKSLGNVFYSMRTEFSDDNGGRAKGSLLIAIVGKG